MECFLSSPACLFMHSSLWYWKGHLQSCHLVFSLD
jgi:hypothetical protein